MQHPPKNSLEELIHRELSTLPEQPAPETLIPQVLARIRARESRRWWQRSWTHWPLPVQLASVPFLLSGALGTIYGFSFLWSLLLGSSEAGRISTALDAVAGIWDVVAVLGSAILVVARAMGQEWLLLALLLPVAMYLACVGLGTLCYRMVACHR